MPLTKLGEAETAGAGMRGQRQNKYEASQLESVNEYLLGTISCCSEV